MNMTEEEKAISMYYDHGISEWHEKSLILTNEEQIIIEKSLITGIDTEILELVRLPFPKFVEGYFSRFHSAKKLLADPESGYKLYFLEDSHIARLSTMLRNRENKGRESEYSVPQKTVNPNLILLKFSLEDIPKLASSQRQHYIYEQKYLYLTQYIDLEEAKRLGLSIVSKFERDMEYTGSLVDGYEFKAKLETLNPVAQFILARVLGLYGHKRESLLKIARELGLPYLKLQELYNMLYPVFLMTLGDFKNKIGYVERTYGIGEFREYNNKVFRETDIILETTFMYNFFLTPEERKVLSNSHGKITREGYIYLGYRFIYKDVAKTAEYMTSTPNEVEKIIRKRL